jgi:LPXTG-motif cell wall-anchored protein
MSEHFQLHRILTAFGVFMFGFQTVSIDFRNLSAAQNHTPLLLMGVGLLTFGLGLYLQRKKERGGE